MTKLFGWTGKILRIDLTNEKISIVPTKKYLHKYIGGRGIAARIYWEEVPAECSAFDPENKLIIMTGPVTGSLMPGSARMMMVGKCPQTYPVESYGRSSAGGHWAPELKFAGYDGVIIEGKAKERKYVSINNDKIDILDASELWGLDTHETQEKIWEKHGEKGKILVIGPAGENLSRIAVISTDSNATFGQGGFGGVMGSKNLKAIVVRGNKGIPIADPILLKDLYRQADFIIKGPKKTASGDAGEIRIALGGGEIGKESKVYEYIEKGKAKWWYDACFSCNGCGKVGVKFNDKSVPSGSSQCVEYGLYLHPEQMYYGGKIYGKVAVEASHLVDMLGINAWEFYFALKGLKPDPSENLAGGLRMDGLGGLNILYYLLKKGVLNKNNTGIDFEKFGSREFIVDLLQNTAYRKGFGNLLAEGLPRALHYMMEHPDEFNLSDEGIKEIELAYQQGYARGGNFGGYPRHHVFCGGNGCGHLYHPNVLRCCLDPNDHSTLHTSSRSIRVPGVTYGSDEYWKIVTPLAEKWMGSAKALDQYTLDYKAEATHHQMCLTMELDCLPLCDFRFPLLYSKFSENKLGDDEIGSKILYAVTGLKKTQKELYEMLDTVWDLERAISSREGRRRKDDWLNEYDFKGMDLEGRRLKKQDLTYLLDEFYSIKGWDLSSGIPTREKLEKVDLKDVADELDKLGLYSSPP